MAKDLTELIQQKPELFKDAIRNQDVTKRVIAMISGIQMWGKRAGIKNVKHIRITGPMKAPAPYDASYKITRKVN